MIKNKRQMAPTLEGIRDDHVERYRFARYEIDRRGIEEAADIGCGCGYGSFILAESGGIAINAFDVDEDAIKYGNENYSVMGIKRFHGDLMHTPVPRGIALVMFEIVEHVQEAPVFLKRASLSASLLILSVPNENVVPFGGPNVHPQHYRHYTPDELRAELDACGWRTVFEGSQKGKRGKDAQIIENNLTGRTLVFVAETSLRGVGPIMDDGVADLGGSK